MALGAKLQNKGSRPRHTYSCVTKIQSQVAKVNLAAKLQCQVTEPRHPAETRVASIFPPKRTAKLQSQGAVKELLAPSN